MAREEGKDAFRWDSTLCEEALLREESANGDDTNGRDMVTEA